MVFIKEGHLKNVLAYAKPILLTRFHLLTTVAAHITGIWMSHHPLPISFTFPSINNCISFFHLFIQSFIHSFIHSFLSALSCQLKTAFTPTIHDYIFCFEKTKILNNSLPAEQVGRYQIFLEKNQRSLVRICVTGLGYN